MINNISKYKIKNFKFLNYFKNKEFQYNLISSIKKDNFIYTFFIKNYILIFYFKKINYLFIKKTNLKLRCVLTENTHSINYFFSLNRISLRKFFSYGLINGFYKSSW
jgi:ribosomal protein S14